VLAGLLGALLLVSGCASGGFGGMEPGLSPAQSALRSSQGRYSSTDSSNYMSTVAEGAAVGAIAGALLGALLDSRNRGRGALIGGAAGAGLGGMGGAAVADRNRGQAHSEQARIQSIQKAEADARNFHNAALAARQVVAEARGRSAQLERQWRDGQISAAQYRQEMQRYQGDLNAMRSVQSDAGRVSGAMRQASSQVDTSRMPAAASSVDKQAADIAQSHAELAAILSRVPRT
jgi:outer membrane lipoprotein SlyB